MVNEEGNVPAERAVKVALEYIRRSGGTLGIAVDLEMVVGNRTDAKGLLESCKLQINSFHSSCALSNN